MNFECGINWRLILLWLREEIPDVAETYVYQHMAMCPFCQKKAERWRKNGTCKQ
jgi:hypothetical protein